MYTDQVESGCADPFQLKNEKKKKQNNNVIYMKGERKKKKTSPGHHANKMEGLRAMRPMKMIITNMIMICSSKQREWVS